MRNENIVYKYYKIIYYMKYDYFYVMKNLEFNNNKIRKYIFYCF